MADRGDALALEGRGRGEQRARGGKEQLFPAPLLHLPQQVPAQHRRGASAAAGPGVHVLLFDVVEQHPAVLVVLAHVHPVLGEQVHDNLVAQHPQIPGQHQVVVLWAGAGGGKVGGQGVISSGGWWKIRPIIKIIPPWRTGRARPAGPAAAGIRPDIETGW